MKLVATGSSVIGVAHRQDNTPNQDAIMIRGIQKGWGIAVCDGLGSRGLSHIGSNRCTLITHAIIKEKRVSAEASPLAISQQIQLRWLNTFGKDYPLYETTCLWACVNARGEGKASQVGDGLILIKSQDRFQVLTPIRDGFGNQTQTLSNAKESDWITAGFNLTKPGDGVLVMTDGISDDLITEQLEGFFDTVYQQVKQSNKRRCKLWLTRELNDWSTPKHGDDKSIAGIFRIE